MDEAPRRRRHARSGPGLSRYLTRVAGLTAALTALGLVVWTLLPYAVGWRAAVVVSGSMRPAVRPGDVLVYQPVPARALVPGQVVLVRSPARYGEFVAHRMVARRGDGSIVTKGDANGHADSTPIPPGDVVGVARLDVPLVGELFRARTPIGVAVAVFLLGGVAWARGGRASGSSGGRSRRRVAVAVTASTVAVASVASVLLSTGSAAAFSWTTDSGASAASAATFYTNYPSAVLSDNPYFYYRMNDQGTTANDSSPNGRNGTYSGSVSCCVAGATTDGDYATGFTGSNSEVSSSSDSNPTNYTGEVWVQTTTTSGGGLFGLYDNSSGYYDRVVYMLNSGQIVFGIDDGTTHREITTAKSYNDGAWHHVAAVLSSTTGMTLYVDGSLVGSNSNTVCRNYTGPWTLGYVDLLGAPTAPSSYYLSGNLDEFAIYHTALNASQIGGHYAAK